MTMIFELYEDEDPIQAHLYCPSIDCKATARRALVTGAVDSRCSASEAAEQPPQPIDSRISSINNKSPIRSSKKERSFCLVSVLRRISFRTDIIVRVFQEIDEGHFCLTSHTSLANSKQITSCKTINPLHFSAPFIPPSPPLASSMRRYRHLSHQRPIDISQTSTLPFL